MKNHLLPSAAVAAAVSVVKISQSPCEPRAPTLPETHTNDQRKYHRRQTKLPRPDNDRNNPNASYHTPLPPSIPPN